jgi:hypothetical protein
MNINIYIFIYIKHTYKDIFLMYVKGRWSFHIQRCCEEVLDILAACGAAQPAVAAERVAKELG